MRRTMPHPGATRTEKTHIPLVANTLNAFYLLHTYGGNTSPSARTGTSLQPCYARPATYPIYFSR